jgi:ribonuclease D
MPLEHMILCDTPDALAAGLADLDDLEVIGVDVERADWDRYYRAAALIQVGGHGRVALIDPIRLEDLSPLQDLLIGRTTVLHALENDLGPMASAGVVPERVEDTAVAAAILGLPTGLEGLLRDLLGVELEGDKSAMQRAQWEERPLTPAMLAYAAGDVADLPALWTELAAQLDATGRTEWYRQELDATLSMPSVEERRDWSRLKGIGRLDPTTRARARQVWEVREDLARNTDTAPSRILGDKVLVDLAVSPPTGKGDLGRRGVRRQAVRDFGEAIVDALTDPVDRERASTAPRQRPPTDADRALVDRLRVLRSERAQEIGVDAGILCPNRTLMSAVLADPATPEEIRAALSLRPWQWEQLADAFIEAFDDVDHGQGPADGPPPPPSTSEGAV